MNRLKEAIENYFGWFAIASISLVIFALYQHALGSGFILDDATSIRVEPLMIQGDILPLYEKFKLRFVGYLSFWANYQISGEDPVAFRLANICIHSVNGMLLVEWSTAFIIWRRLCTSAQPSVDCARYRLAFCSTSASDTSSDLYRSAVSIADGVILLGGVVLLGGNLSV